MLIQPAKLLTFCWNEKPWEPLRSDFRGVYPAVLSSDIQQTQEPFYMEI